MDVGKVAFEVLVGELEVGQEVGDDFWLDMRRRWGERRLRTFLAVIYNANANGR
jgi:hypothetical protein